MNRQRAYAYRYLHAAGPFVVSVFFYAYFLAPLLTVATGWNVFRFLDEWILGVLGWWTGSGSYSVAYRYTPGWPDLMGFHFGSVWGRSPFTTAVFLIVGAVLAAGATAAFLWPLRDRQTLPASRQVGPLAHLAVAFGWAMVLLAAVLQATQHNEVYDKFASFTLTEPAPQPALRPWAWIPPKQPTPLPFLGSLAILTLLAWGVLLFFRPRAVQFWRLERLSFWLLVAAAGVLAWVLVVRVLGIPSPKWRADLPPGPAFENATFLALSVLLWAWTCRVILLFNFARYERAASDHPDTSCFACGYDLRGSTHSASCPECGAKIVVSVTVPETK